MRDEELLDRLLLISDLMGSDLSRYLTRHGLTSAKAHLLWTVHHDGPRRQRDLAVTLGHSPRHVTTLVDELIEAGYVTRSAHPDDRRAVLIEPTAAATALLDEMASGRVTLAGQLFGGLDQADRRQLGVRLDDLADRLTARVAADAATGTSPPIDPSP